MNKWLTSLIAILTVTGLHAQAIEPPKLIVSIVVDQLRGDYLDYFSPSFGEKGFKKLMNDGLVYRQVDFEFPNLSKASSIATIYTGTYPFYHGIVGDKKMDLEKQQAVSIIQDKEYLGNYTSENYSPLALLSTTVGDELKIASGGRSDVYAIASSAEEAILSVGRYANAAFWLDDYNNKWATTTYYKDIPWYVERHNTARIKNEGKAQNAISLNSEITHLTEKFLEYSALSKRINSDLLTLSYYAGSSQPHTSHDAQMQEMREIYIRLDKELENLFALIEKKMGMKNVLIVLTSTGYYDSYLSLPAEYKPFGEFHPNRCVALLNMYLMATYGQGNWVDGYYNNQLYFNKKLVENKQIKWADFIRDAADFVSQFSGVQDVTTLGQWMVDDNGRSADFRRGMHKKLSGDLFIELQPGWVIVNEKENSEPQYERSTAVLSPLFFWGEGISKGQIHRKIKATEIAPTLAYILHIRPPTASKEAPLQEIIKK